MSSADVVRCPVCDALSEQTYRCDQCGKDLVEEQHIGREEAERHV
jgi:DNA-directed RNA polymerase subunit RPC12/RpoP